MPRNILIAAVLAGFSMSAQAAPAAGDWEILLGNAQGSLYHNDNSTQLNLSLEAGYFFTERHQLGAGLNYFYYDSDFGSDRDTDISAFYRYHHRNSQDDAWFFGGLKADPDVYQLQFGRKWVVEENVMVELGAAWNEPHRIDYLDGFVSLQFGLGVYF